MAAHSPVGGSGMDRWQYDHCPGSVTMGYYYPNNSSYAAEEGTAAHELAELCAKTGRHPSYYVELFINGIEIDPVMTEHIAGYLDHVYGLGMWADTSHFEASLQMPGYPLIMGTVDHLALSKVAYVTDLKYGFMPVLATAAQLMYYAALVRSNYGRFERYVLSIYQPRLFNRAAADTVIITDDELARWIDSMLLPSVELAMSGTGVRRPGKWCRYCPGKMDCPELKQQIQFLQPPFHNNAAEIAQLLSIEGAVKSAIEDLKVEALNRTMRGETIPGFKAVRRAGRGSINNERAFVAAMELQGIDRNQLYKKELIGLTELRKLNQYTVNEYTVRNDTRPTIAPLSDPSPAVATLLEQFGAPS